LRILKVWAVNAILERGLAGEIIDYDVLYEELSDFMETSFIQDITRRIREGPDKLYRLHGQHRRTFILSYLDGLSDEEAASFVSLTVERFQRQKTSLLNS
jgi:DNA-directed RNA polymerase specialized sigma24 family protein